MEMKQKNWFDNIRTVRDKSEYIKTFNTILSFCKKLLLLLVDLIEYTRPRTRISSFLFVSMLRAIIIIY